MEHLDFDTMPSIGLSVMIVGITTKTVKNVDGKSILDFYVEENLGDREAREFWVEVRHDPNLRYLANKTNSINQSMRSTTAILMGLIEYEPAVIDEVTQEELTSGKHVIKLEDISLVSTNQGKNQQALNVPWMNGSSNKRSGRAPRGATSRAPKRGRLSQMGLTRNQSLASALKANPVPVMDSSPTVTAITAATTNNDPSQVQEEE